MNREYKYLKFIWFKDLTRWDVKNYIKQGNAQLNLSFLKDHIKEENKKVKIFEEKETKFGILGVNNKEGIFDAYLEYGKNINQPYKKVKEGFLAYNPYRINVGSIGLKTKEHKYEYISPAYVVFSCKESILPEFLFNLFKTESFNRLITDNTTGSVRQILSFENLGNIQLALPSIEIQKALVESHSSKMKEGKEKEEKANKLEAEIETYLKAVLGIETAIQETKATKYKYLKFISFAKLKRWDLDYLLENGSELKSLYPLFDLGSLIQYLRNGIAERNFSTNGVKYIRVGNISNNEITDKDLKFTNSFQESDLLKQDTFLITRKGTVGEVVIVEKDNEMVASSEVFIITLKDKVNGIEILPQYLAYVNYTFFLKKQYEEKYTGALMPSISQDKLKTLKFPLPPIEIQKEIAVVVSSRRAEIKLLRSEAEALKLSAKKEFESTIFKTL